LRQCNGEISARQSGVVPGGGDHRDTQISGTARGLELIKSCAKFYANGVAAAKPTVQVSDPTGHELNHSATSPSGVATVSNSTIAARCLFFLVLLSLPLATILWWGVIAPTAKGREEEAGYASTLSAQAASQGLRPPRSLHETTEGQAVPRAQLDIVIHKVKTKPIAARAWGAADRDGRSAQISATD
jgi:hypothetical protein